jgi:hypothetical protein
MRSMVEGALGIARRFWPHPPSVARFARATSPQAGRNP